MGEFIIPGLSVDYSLAPRGGVKPAPSVKDALSNPKVVREIKKPVFIAANKADNQEKMMAVPSRDLTHLLVSNRQATSEEVTSQAQIYLDQITLDPGVFDQLVLDHSEDPLLYCLRRHKLQLIFLWNLFCCLEQYF